MKKTKFTKVQLVFALSQADTGVTVVEVCRKMGISEATYYESIMASARTVRYRI